MNRLGRQGLNPQSAARKDIQTQPCKEHSVVSVLQSLRRCMSNKTGKNGLAIGKEHMEIGENYVEIAKSYMEIGTNYRKTGKPRWRLAEKGRGSKRGSGGEGQSITFCWFPQTFAEPQLWPAEGVWHTSPCRFPVVAAGLPTCQSKAQLTCSPSECTLPFQVVAHFPQ